MENPLGIKRFGPAVFYINDVASEAKRISSLFGMDIAFLPSDSDQIFGLKSGDATFILDGSASGEADAKKYGNHIREIGIYVENVNKAFSHIKSSTDQPASLCSKTGSLLLKAPHDGEVYFRFLEEDHLPYHGVKLDKGYTPSNFYAFNRIDHIVTNTQSIEPIITFLKDVMGMKKVNEFTIMVQAGEFMASLYSEVMGIETKEHPILFPINEPLAGDSESQIPAQIKEMGRSHAQHIALATDDIVSSIRALRQRGVAFLDFRNEGHAKRYYEEVPARLGAITVDQALETLQELGILVDKCGEGYLLQLFTSRIFPDRSVPFIEIIQRASDVIGCFGDGNFAALAESLEWAMRQGQVSAT